MSSTSWISISVGTFYLYFGGKDDLFVQLVLEYTNRLRASSASAGSGAPFQVLPVTSPQVPTVGGLKNSRISAFADPGRLAALWLPEVA